MIEAAVYRRDLLIVSRIIKYWSTERKLRTEDANGSIRFVKFDPRMMKDFSYELRLSPGTASGMDNETIAETYKELLLAGAIDLKTYATLTDIPKKQDLLKILGEQDQLQGKIQELEAKNQEMQKQTLMMKANLAPQTLTPEEIKIVEQFAIEEQQAQITNAMQDFTSEAIVMRVFSVSNFGIFNSDCPNSLPQGASINPIYVANDKPITPNTIYLICHNKNLVYNLQYGTLKFNPKDAYSLCIISNGKMYLCNKETFTSIASSKENKIPLTELSNDVNDAIDLRKAIGI
jgi:hypothetical protein